MTLKRSTTNRLTARRRRPLHGRTGLTDRQGRDSESEEDAAVGRRLGGVHERGGVPGHPHAHPAAAVPPRPRGDLRQTDWYGYKGFSLFSPQLTSLIIMSKLV